MNYKEIGITKRIGENYSVSLQRTKEVLPQKEIFEIVDRKGDPEDGGPIAIAWCEDAAMAEYIAHLLDINDRHSDRDFVLEEKL